MMKKLFETIYYNFIHIYNDKKIKYSTGITM